MTDTDHEYLLGTNDAELARLGFQHEVWAAATAEAWERGGFAPGARLLDVGCGPGWATLAMARLVGPAGHVLGVDASARFLAHLDAARERDRLGQIATSRQQLEALDLPAASFDGAFARWVLCYLRDPQTVVDRVARALRPGGTFVVMDYAHYLGIAVAPPSAVIARVLAAISRSFARDGGNSDVGRDVPALMRRAGLTVRSIRPLVRIARPGTALWEWPATFFENYLPALVAMGEITDADRTAFVRDWAERSRSPDAFLITPTMTEIVGVRDAG